MRENYQVKGKAALYFVVVSAAAVLCMIKKLFKTIRQIHTQQNQKNNIKVC